MKKLFTLIVISFFLSCGSSKKDNPEVPKEGEEILLAAVTLRDTSRSRILLWVKRKIVKDVRYDSVLKKDIIVIDTIIGYPVTVPKVDSLNRPIMGADGKPVIDPVIQYLEVAESFEDSVDFHVEGIPMDSLLRKK